MLKKAKQNLEKWLDIKLLPLLLVSFIGTLGFSVILPFLVFLVQDFGGNAVMYGLIGALYPAFQMLGSPLLGAWSDRVGRKKVLLLSQAGTFLSWVIFLLAFALPLVSVFEVEVPALGYLVLTLPLLVLMVARAFDGLTGGNISVAYAYLADITTPEERKKGYGKLAAATNLGFIIGPALAGVLGALPNGKFIIVLTAASISLLATLVIYFFLPDVPAQLEETSPKEAPNVRVWQVPRFPFFVVLYFLIYLAYNLFYATFPVHASDNLQWDSTELGTFFTSLSAVMIITQAVLLPKLSDQYGLSDKLLFVGGSFLLVLMFGLLAVPSDSLVYLSAVLFGLGNGVMWPSFLSRLSELGTPRQQGSIQGTAGGAGSLASIIGLIAGGLIFSLGGTVVFIYSAVGFAVIGVLGLWFRSGEGRG